MKALHCVISFCYFLYISYSVYGATSNDAVTEIDNSQSYCFRFTWLGPEYDNSTSYNGTCSHFYNDTQATGVPCRDPLVITENAAPPNIDYLWEHYTTAVVCRRARGQVCGKYTYTYNNEIQNISYMCTKVYAIDEGPVTTGCYTQSVDGYDIELCVCESVTGGFKPCNGGTSNFLSMSLLLISTLSNYLINWD